MPVSRSRGATRNPGPTITGTKTLRFTLPHLPRRFTVHEDLICRTSTLFRTIFQRARKPVLSGEECCVCHDALDAVTQDITFCRECGQHVHEPCIEAWKRQKGGGMKLEASCPMCRAAWKTEPLLGKNLVVKGAACVGAEDVQAYIDWLYTDSLRIHEGMERKSDRFNVAVLKCWSVASAMQDTSFKHVVIKLWFDEAEVRFWGESVEWAFLQNCGDDEIRNFVVDVFMAFMEPGWFAQEGRKWPDVFVRALADRALEGWMEGGKTMEGFDSVRVRWMEKFGIVEDQQEGDEHKEEDGREKLKKGTGKRKESGNFAVSRRTRSSRSASPRKDGDELPEVPPIRRSTRPKRQVESYAEHSLRVRDWVSESSGLS